MRHWRTLVVAAALGIAVIELVVIAVPGREPLDVPAYWRFGYPAMFIASAVLGYASSAKPLHIGFALGLGHGLWFMLRSALAGGISNLWPLGLAMFALLSLPLIAAAWAGTWAKEWAEGS